MTKVNSLSNHIGSLLRLHELTHGESLMVISQVRQIIKADVKVRERKCRYNNRTIEVLCDGDFSGRDLARKQFTIVDLEKLAIKKAAH